MKFDPLPHGYKDLSMAKLRELRLRHGRGGREAGRGEVDIIVELHRKLDAAAGAAGLCEALAQFRPLFIEDPIQIDSIQAQAEIARRLTSPIGNGASGWASIWEFRELLVAGGGPQGTSDRTWGWPAA